MNLNPNRTAAISVPSPPPASTPAQPGPTAPAQGAAPDLRSQFAPHPNPPGAAGAFNRPTENPGQPITAGAPFGPGPGPDQLGIPNQQQATLKSLLSFAAAQPGADPGVAYLAGLVNKQM